MSFEAVLWAIKAPVKNSTQRAVLVALANYCNENCKSYPSQATICRIAACKDKKTVRAAMDALEESGLISRKPRFREDGSRTSDLVTLHLSDIPMGGGKDPQGVGDNFPQGGGKVPQQEPRLITKVIEPSSSDDAPQLDLTPEAEQPEDDADYVLRIWREICVPAGLADVRAMSEKRKSAARARVKQFSREDLKTACEKLAASSHCTGMNDRGWRATFDFLTNPEKMTKILEGDYDDRLPKSAFNAGGSDTSGATEQRRQAALELLADERAGGTGTGF